MKYIYISDHIGYDTKNKNFIGKISSNDQKVDFFMRKCNDTNSNWVYCSYQDYDLDEVLHNDHRFNYKTKKIYENETDFLMEWFDVMLKIEG